jgi:hypothetical protein
VTASCRLGIHALALATIFLVATGARAQSAFVTITESLGINASSYNANSFVVTNTSSGDDEIVEVRLDLSTTIFPDMVFDPEGEAGDAAAKCFVADSGATTVGLVTPANACSSPFSEPHNDGYDVLELSFTDFDPGETFGFSVDADPTSIRGTDGNGGGSSGSVSGLELTGAIVTVTFEGGAVRTGEIFRQPGSNGGGQNEIRSGAPPAPSIQAVGLSSPSSTSDATQTIRITGPAGESVRLLRVEGMLDLNGGNGFDLDPFEANRAIVVAETAATIGGGGTVDVNVTLTRTNDDAGFNYFAAAIDDDDGSGRTGPTSNVVRIELVDAVPECSTNGDCADGNPCTTDTCNAGSCSRTDNSASCDDGLFCNGDDTCSGGTCSSHDGDPCAGGPQCADSCNEGANSCDSPAGTPCDDGLFCNGDDTCSAGTCSAHDGDPCAGGPQCADFCDESENACLTPAGTACEDGDACTTSDACDGDGACLGGIPVTCDDGDACNGVETCDAELGCLPGETVQCSDDPGVCLTNARCEDGECVADPLCDSDCEVCAGESICLSRCGHAVSDPSGPIVATDALATLTAAVSGSGCALCVCDVDASGAIVATDALELLTRVVDPEIEIACTVASATVQATTTTSTLP